MQTILHRSQMETEFTKKKIWVHSEWKPHSDSDGMATLRNAMQAGYGTN